MVSLAAVSGVCLYACVVLCGRVWPAAVSNVCVYVCVYVRVCMCVYVVLCVWSCVCGPVWPAAVSNVCVYVCGPVWPAAESIGAIVLCFRGTVTMSNIVTDLKAATSHLPPTMLPKYYTTPAGKRAPQVHAGWLQAYFTIRAQASRPRHSTLVVNACRGDGDVDGCVGRPGVVNACRCDGDGDAAGCGGRLVGGCVIVTGRRIDRGCRDGFGGCCVVVAVVFVCSVWPR